MKLNYFKLTIILMLVLCSVSINAQRKNSIKAKNQNSQKQIKTGFDLTESTKRSIKETGFARCLTTENEIQLKKKYPERLNAKEFEQWLSPKIAKLKKERTSRKNSKTAIIYNIPVVIHIVHNGDAINTVGNIVGENISDAQAQSQIDVMNQDYRRKVGTPGGANSTGLAVDVEINFCLAVQDPNGYSTTGIIRQNITPYNNNVLDGPGGVDWETEADVNEMKTNTQWDPTKYLNMWTFRPGGLDLDSGGLDGLLGYAQFPSASALSGLNTSGGLASTDGVVAGFDAFGTITNNDGSFVLNSNYNLGRTMTHEVGHWLGLLHTWGDGDCAVDDYCNDTPTTGEEHYTCDVFDTCTDTPIEDDKNDMVENYMDYTNDACMDTFTADQKTRMITVMENSPRRKELNSSIACVDPIPSIFFDKSSINIIEGTSCNYKDINIELKIAAGPSADATINFTVVSETAEEGVDYEFENSSVIFKAGSTDSKILVLRVYEDSFDELNEFLTIGMLLVTTGDAIIDTVRNSEINIVIGNDDARDVGLVTAFSEDFESYTDFEIGNIGGWTMNDLDDNLTYSFSDVSFNNESYIGTFILFNPSQTTPASSAAWNAHGGEKGYYCFAATSLPNGTALNNDYIYTPQINLSGTGSELKFWAKSITDDYGLERFNIKVSTTDTDVESFTTILPSSPAPSLSPYQEAPTTWTEYTYDLSSYDTETVYIAFHVVSEDAYAFMLDDISVTTNVNLNAQTEVNLPDQNLMNRTGEIFTRNDENNNLMVDINNVNGVDYGCVKNHVSRAFNTETPAVQENASGVSNYVMSKKFTITPTTINVSGNSILKFYFTETEIAAWETATGNNRNDLVVFKDNGTSIESNLATIGSYSLNISLETDFSSGIDGDYFFGIASVLNVKESEFELFSLYPNPTTNELNLSLSTSKDVKVTIFDMLGRKVFKKNYANSLTRFSKNITLNLTKGVYLLNVESGNKQAIKKIIIE